MKKVKLYSSLALISLSASLLVACTSNKNETATNFSKSEQTSQSSSQLSQTSQNTATEIAAPPQSLTSEQIAQAPSTDIVTEEEVQTIQTVLAEVTEVTQEKQEEPSENPISVTTASPGAAEGNWTSAAGYNLILNPDGTLGDNITVIYDSYTDANGIVYMNAYSTDTGYGFYIHYYPAGVPLVFTVYDYDNEGNVIEIEQTDYTDSSRDRIFAGNGGNGIMKDGLDDYLNNVFYRQ